MADRYLVLGTGSFGTALAVVLARRGHRVSLWGRRPDHVEAMCATRENADYLPGVPLGPEIEPVSGDPPRAADFAGVVSAVPTQHLRATLTPHADRLTGRPVLSCAKGIENGSLQRPSEVLREVLGRVPVTVLSGPSHAEELARGLPATLVAAGPTAEAAAEWQRAMSGDTFRVYTSDDPIGVEIGGALKNVIAVAAGTCDGLGLGDNAKAALVSRGIVEMARLGGALGARKSTFFGLSGIGDLIVTCHSRHGRNLRVGREIGSGRRVADVLAGMKMVAEGVWTARAARELGRQKGVELPIIEETYHVLYEDLPPLQGLKNLMARDLKSETEDLQ